MRAQVQMEALLEGVAARRRRELGRAASILEDQREGFDELMASVYGRTGGARVIGITGPPGAGKSTLVDRMTQVCRQRDETVAVLAVDPSSPFTGGALLGDRVRMQGFVHDRDVFIRSMATRGALGGVAGATRDIVDLMDAAGFDWVLVETVGVGQDETDIVRTVDEVVVVTVPGLGDEIQAIKAGIMEIGDVFVVNKADRDGAGRTVRDLESALGLLDPEGAPPVMRTVASRGTGVEELIDQLIETHRRLESSGELASRRFDHLRLRVDAILKMKVLQEVRRSPDFEERLSEAWDEKIDPHRLATRLFDELARRAAQQGGER